MGASPKVTVAAVKDGPVVSATGPTLSLSLLEGVPEPDTEDDKNGQQPRQPPATEADTVAAVTEEGPTLPDALPGTPLAENVASSVNTSPSPATVSRTLLNESVITFRWGKHTLGPEANRSLEAVPYKRSFNILKAQLKWLPTPIRRGHAIITSG